MSMGYRGRFYKNFNTKIFLTNISRFTVLVVLEHVIILLFTNLPVFIQSIRGPSFYLETQPSYTIGHIKTMIQEKNGIPPDELKLRFTGQLLKDGHTLSDYDIRDGSKLYSNIGRMYIHVMLILFPPCTPLQIILENQLALVSSEL